MPTHRPLRNTIGLGVGRRTAVALSVLLASTLTAMPTASAIASFGKSKPALAEGSASVVTSLGGLDELAPEGELDTLLSNLPLSDLDTEALTHYLAGLPGIGTLAELPVGLLGLEELGVAGLEAGLHEAIDELGSEATLGELVDPADLLPKLEGKLNGLLASLLGAVLGQSATQALGDELGSLDLEQLVGSLLENTSEPEQLLGLCNLMGGFFGALSPTTLEGALGSTLTGQFVPTTVETVAEEWGTSEAELAEGLGESSEQLSPTTSMLTAPLANGQMLGIAPAIKGLAVGLLSSGEGGGNEGGGEGPGGEGPGEGPGPGTGEGPGTGQGGAGGGAQGTGGRTATSNGQGTGGVGAGATLVVNVLPSAAQTAGSRAGKATKRVARIRILSRHVKGGAVTVAVRVPVAGRVTLSGRGMQTVRRQAKRAGVLTLRARLSTASVAFMRTHRHLTVKLTASFKPTRGAGSSTRTTVTF
jgi:hypothetical protein